MKLSQVRPTVSGSRKFSYSIVREAWCRSAGCTLVTETPMKVRSRVDLGTIPDRIGVQDLAASGLRALSVSLDVNESGVVGSSALFASADGPRRLALAEGVAVALCLDGHRTVIVAR